ncbi:siderophore-interacting protein [Isoptericola halotolerans]|uniref:NADPH-dependent ferric siderophore reductase n=1 Tax=Isoptericola halotolerans TaxID=300560 RepID=A0ABX2A168_9MICO|nr:siderophore-interacting protein [Isoptericola halotolerans]NOV96544.1 NADPH-dependent ferric siderophore reductase [Isoptericola halotolerans]
MTDTTSRRGGPPGGKRTQHHATVSAVRRLTPHMVRLTLAGDALDAIPRPAVTDLYIKLVVGEPATPEGKPLVRTYTVRAVRDGEWDVDFVVHGDEGIAGPWAGRAQPGEKVTFLGPGGSYAPDLSAPWHLFVGDDSALPAIAASVESLPAGTTAHAFVEVPGPADEQEIVTAADLSITWVHREVADLTETVRDARTAGRLPDGAPHAFLHGEASCVRELRRWVRAELGVGKERLSASGYWRRGHDDEAWRAAKADWNAAVEQDDAAL